MYIQILKFLKPRNAKSFIPNTIDLYAWNWSITQFEYQISTQSFNNVQSVGQLFLIKT